MMDMTKKIVVSGSTGQDGSYMIEYLLANTQDTIIAAIRRTSQAILSNLKNVIDNPRVKLVTVDLCDGEAVRKLIREEKPDYFINFGAQTFVSDSWTHPVAHMQTNAISLIHILESIREYVPHCRLYSSGSSEQYGNVQYSPQDDKHPMMPRSIYGVSKCTASLICKVYRESYGLYVVHGVLFNHESERRQEYFVTRKITKAVARIARAIKDGKPFEPLELGNIDAKRDWSHAEDFVQGVWLMLNQEEYDPKWQDALNSSDMAKQEPGFKEAVMQLCLSGRIWSPKEYILSSNETHTVREFVERAFDAAGIKGRWLHPDDPVNETFYQLATSISEPDDRGNATATLNPILLMVINPAFYRPAEVELLLGDSGPARRELGWSPKVSFDDLVRRMVNHDLSLVDL